MSQHHPPHLPPHTVSVGLHNLFSRTKSFLVFVGISLLAGITGALIVSAWIDPQFYDASNTLVYRGKNQSLVSPDLPDPFVLQRYQQSTLSLFAQSSEVADGWYRDDGFVGALVMLTSDGWGVAYVPDMTVDQKLKLHVRNEQGDVFSIEHMVYDPIYDLSYFKLKGDDFYVLPFATWDGLSRGTSVWSVHARDWQYRTILARRVVVTPPYRLTDVYERFVLDGETSEPGVLISPQGQFVGFVDDAQLLHSAWSVSYQIASLLTDGSLALPDITTTGYVVHNTVQISADDMWYDGFFVTDPGNQTAVRAGDIIIAIDGVAMNLETLQRTIYKGGDHVTFTVWRDGKEFDILLGNE